MHPSDERVAAIDVGTQTALMLVARARPGGGVEEIEHFCEHARLGFGLARTGALHPLARSRTRALLADWVERAAALGVPRTRIRGVGTAVFRRAVNGTEFARELAHSLRIRFDIATEEEEARGYLHAANGMPETVAVVDVGGGTRKCPGSAAAGGARCPWSADPLRRGGGWGFRGTCGAGGVATARGRGRTRHARAALWGGSGGAGRADRRHRREPRGTRTRVGRVHRRLARRHAGPDIARPRLGGAARALHGRGARRAAHRAGAPRHPAGRPRMHRRGAGALGRRPSHRPRAWPAACDCMRDARTPVLRSAPERFLVIEGLGPKRGSEIDLERSPERKSQRG